MLTDEELKGVLEGFDTVINNATTLAEDLKSLKRKLKKEEKDKEKKE